MRGYLPAICVISFAVCVMPVYAQQEDDPAFNVNEARRFLDLHNEVRRNASVQPLTWSNGLAAGAQRVVNTCVWSAAFHSPKAMTYLGRRNASSDSSPELAMQHIVKQMVFIVNKETKECCSHYNIQCCLYAKVVTPEFRSLGCGQNICNFTQTTFTYDNAYVAVCAYSNSSLRAV